MGPNLDMIYLIHGVKVQFEVVQFQLRWVQCHQVVLVVELVEVKLVPSMAWWPAGMTSMGASISTGRLPQPPPVSIPNMPVVQKRSQLGSMKLNSS